ncbi:lanthionine synthetase C family protein [Amycolatopsis sp. CA-230715]|uniref:lanthionine synthetase C family protein n=1 Tax=Amycolatopsis sp. CA-230715 TaxID=2745196 RepID=UPI001C00974F|nr:lanthionine synthetase C family protein [Amycolatopsis sp. CA-230715]QWF81080.1 Nisin biosynthesis protein NisC [Amycolatopsis sp. CA-230715]
MTTTQQPGTLSERLAAQLAAPVIDPDDHSGREQSLSEGAAGIALLHVERALASTGSWATAHAWVTAATSRGVSTAADTNLYLGASAISFLLSAAQADGRDRYQRAATMLEHRVLVLARHRVETSAARASRGEATSFGEYDVFTGLTGIGRLLLQHNPDADVLEQVLDYFVRLTEPRPDQLPGWWVAHDPDTTIATPGGHANLGLAHGVCGVLAFLGTALRQGVTVEGHADAIARICGHLDTWRHDDDSGPWWPEWLTLDEIRTGRALQRGPLRPSWCYGTPGIARAQQIAAIATGDTARQHLAEDALAACLADPGQLAHVTDTSLCHGWAGLYQTAWRAAQDALTPNIAAHLPRLAASLSHADSDEPEQGSGLLTGTAGLALAAHTATHHTPPISGWDACLLIT